jgi:competence/damage-inducible protein CinA-like protein
MAPRTVTTAEILSVGSELTVGETRDTNGGELARALTDEGVQVLRLTAIPDDLTQVTDAFGRAAIRADLVVSTGGLGPTPDDLTREAIAGLVGETPAVDDRLEAWLREMWFRRGMPFPEINLKQAWLIPSASAIPNMNGTAPGWWLERSDGGLIVALPGPPREMRPMWADGVMPRLRERGLGEERATRTLRLWGIGESQAADLLGEELLRASNPVVATYARTDSVDVRISAVADAGRPARTIADDTERRVLDALDEYVWGRDDETWPAAIGRRLADRGWTLAISETGTGGALTALLGELPGLVRSELHAAGDGPAITDVERDDLEAVAGRVRRASGADVGLSVVARPHGGDTQVSVAVAAPSGSHRERRLVFQGGAQGRSRAALTAASILLRQLASSQPSMPVDHAVTAVQPETVR